MYLQRSGAAENPEVQHTLISSPSAMPERIVPSRLCQVLMWHLLSKKGLLKPIEAVLVRVPANLGGTEKTKTLFSPMILIIHGL